jgi:hypothetical protein
MRHWGHKPLGALVGNSAPHLGQPGSSAMSTFPFVVILAVSTYKLGKTAEMLHEIYIFFIAHAP